MSFRGDGDAADIKEAKQRDWTQNERRPWDIARFDFSMWQGRALRLQIGCITLAVELDEAFNRSPHALFRTDAENGSKMKQVRGGCVGGSFAPTGIRRY